MIKQSLSSQTWSVSAMAATPVEVPESLPVTVPGSVHSALLDAQLIGDVWYGQNEKAQHWVGQTPWRFACEITEVPEGERVDLVCDGLDTVATLRLGTRELGRTENMHRTYRFDVTEALQASRALQIDFASAVKEIDRRHVEQGSQPHVNHHPFNALRKMACSFGWDWGPDTATCAIWRDIRLEGWSTARFVRVLTDARPTDDGGGTVTVRASVERLSPAPLTVVARLGDATASAEIAADTTEVEFVLQARDVERWWPIGHGEAVLHDLHVGLLAGDDEIDAVDRKIGFRTVEWRTDREGDTTRFDLHVNGRLIEVHGVNWIPDHQDVTTITRERLAERLDQAIACNTNLVRIWGGGMYESDDFYDLADERGLLVWQDFLLACAAYSEDDPLRSEFIAEAQDNVARLGHRASLVLWNGCNENIWGHHEWGWERLLDGQAWGLSYYTEIFPAIVAELAPTSWYTPGSPWSPTGDGIEMQPELSPNDQHHGSMHIWDMWNQRPMANYRDYRPHFVAEFGWQGPPAWTTMQDFGDDPLTPESPGTFVHQKAAVGNDKLTAGLLPNLALPRDIEQWHWAMQWNQAEAIRTAIGWYRSLFPYCTGTVTWQLNDCWPVISWAAVDSYGRHKPLFHALRQVNAPRLLTIQPVDGLDAAQGLRVTLVNDTDEAIDAPLVVRRVTFAGDELARQEQVFSVDARSAATVKLAEVAHAGDEASELLVAEVAGERALWWFTSPRTSALEPARVKVEVADGQVTVTAENLVRDLTVLVDKANPDARVDDGLVTLLPGESFTFAVRGEVDQAGAERALASVNQLVAGA